MIVIILLIPVIVLAAICWLIYRIALKFNHPKLGIAISAGLIAFIFFNVYTAIYPDDSFYFDDYKEITLRNAPKSASIIRKSASYPDQHGDYTSVSLMDLSALDYESLLSSIRSDPKFHITNQNILISEEYEYVMQKHKYDKMKYSFIRPVKGQEDHYYYIGFLKDKHTILVYRNSY